MKRVEQAEEKINDKLEIRTQARCNDNEQAKEPSQAQRQEAERENNEHASIGIRVDIGLLLFFFLEERADLNSVNLDDLKQDEHVENER